MNEEGSNKDKTRMRDVEQVVLSCAVECVRAWKYYEFAIASRGEGAAELYYPKLQHAEESLQTAVADMLAALAVQP